MDDDGLPPIDTYPWSEPVTFGKYRAKGMTWGQVLDEDPAYIRWVIEDAERPPIPAGLFDALYEGMHELAATVPGFAERLNRGRGPRF